MGQHSVMECHLENIDPCHSQGHHLPSGACCWGVGVGSDLRGLLAPETVPLRPPTLRRQGPAAPFPFYLKSRWYIRTNPVVGKKGQSHTASTLAELTHRSILKYNPVPWLGLFFGLLSHDQCCLCPLCGLPCCWALCVFAP